MFESDAGLVSAHLLARVGGAALAGLHDYPGRSDVFHRRASSDAPPHVCIGPARRQ